MRFRITDLFKSRKTKIREQAHLPILPPPPKKKEPEENLIPQKGPKTRRSIYSHGYGASSTKNNYMLNLKNKSKRRKKNRIARRQRVLNAKR